MKDLLLGSDGDLLLSNGDAVAGEADEQHVSLMLMTSKGEWRQSPLVGVGLTAYLSGPFDFKIKTRLEQTIRLQLELDGFKVKGVDATNLGAIAITATR